MGKFERKELRGYKQAVSADYDSFEKELSVALDKSDPNRAWYAYQQFCHRCDARYDAALLEFVSWPLLSCLFSPPEKRLKRLIKRKKEAALSTLTKAFTRRAWSVPQE